MEELRTLRPSELEQAVALDTEAFQPPPERRELFRQVDPSRVIGAFDGGRLVGMVAWQPMRQIFGGRAVAMGGVHSVAVAPDRRGRGLAQRMLAALLAAMREHGEAITTLFPATSRTYRAVGYELAGTMCWRRIAPRALEILPRAPRARLRPVAADEIPELSACYDEVARGTNGFLQRPSAWWRAARDHLWRGRSVFAAEGADGRISGYVAYRPLDGEYSSLGGPFRLALDEILWSERDAGLALWGLLASWVSQVDSILYRSAAEDPLLWLLPEQEIGLVVEVRWLSRILDPVAAIAARGFAAGVDAEAHLELVDPILSGSAGRFVLRVSKGRGELAPGGRGDVRIDAGALASLFTGYATPDALARAGRLAGEPGASRDALAAAFAGPTPWMPDQF